MKKRFNQIVLPEKDEHKKTKSMKLSPAMRNVDHIFGVMDAKPSDFLNSLEKTIKDAARKFKVREDELMKYFEREMLGEYDDLRGKVNQCNACNYIYQANKNKSCATNAGTVTPSPAVGTFNAQSALMRAITISSHGFVTGDEVTYSDGGGTAIAELTDGGQSS